MDPKDLSRRDFLKLIGAASAGAAILGGAGLDLDEAEAAYPYYLTVAKGGNSDAAACTRAAIKGLGGMGRFVKSGQTVIIKPNMCTPYRTAGLRGHDQPRRRRHPRQALQGRRGEERARHGHARSRGRERAEGGLVQERHQGRRRGGRAARWPT